MSVSHAAYEAMVEHLADRDETIVRLSAELEDVRQQRETLKAECAVLSNHLEQAAKNAGKQKTEAERLRAEVERAKSWSDAVTEQADKLVAEVERHGKMLRHCLPYLKHVLHRNEYHASILTSEPNRSAHAEQVEIKRALIEQIESLDNAPDPSTDSEAKE